MMEISKGTKYFLGSMALGALAGLAYRGWKRARARRADVDPFKTVALFATKQTAQVTDAEWEGLEGRALFKQLCGKLAAAGFPPSDVGDIEAAHTCVVHVDGTPLYLTMEDNSGAAPEWILYVTRSLGTARRAGPPPADTSANRSFLATLDGVITSIDGTRDIRWQRREDAR